MRHAERELALQAQRADERTDTDWPAAAKAGASARPGRASQSLSVLRPGSGASVAPGGRHVLVCGGSAHRAGPAPGSERRAMRASLGGRRVVLDAAEA